ncbi:TonB-dependent receptor [Granulicella aggregans]|uniref:TonB-dependent receptor n=1 Tax=Granulicella aggregans TaxID=474949 RepID=UPI001FEAC125|nr:TonB-dependent receptor [Granulicella aggregans]
MRSITNVRAGIYMLAALLLLVTNANAVIVKGTVTDPLGAVVIGARIQLIQGQQVIALGVSGVDGIFEIRSTAKGRFRLLGSAATFTPGVGKDFYGGVTEVVSQNVVLEIASVTEQVTVTATGIETPVQQTSAALSLIGYEEFATRLGVVDALRQAPGVQFVQQGQLGGVSSLFVRGGSSTANKVLIDGITAEDVGGVFDYGTLSSTAISSAELYRGPNSVLYGSDAGAAVVSFNTPRGESVRPVFVYKGEGGNFSTYRNQAEFSGTRQKLDYYAAFSRLNTSNALPLDEYHSITEAANLGYALFPGVLARFTLRNGVSASGLPGAHDFFGISNNGKQSDQDLYSGLTLESRTNNDRWHNLVRYGVTRKREQFAQYAYEGTVIPVFGFPENFGNVVTIRGANGYSATGQTSFFGSNSNASTNRDELFFQSDYAFSRHLSGLGSFRYENERGTFVLPDFVENERIKRTNYEYTLQFQGDIKNRLFYSVGGAIEKNHLYGIAGTPRIGLAYVPVRISNGWFRGTKVRASAATGVQEPTLSLEFASLYTQLQENDPNAAVDIAAYNIRQPTAQRSRSYDAGVEQNIHGERLIFKAGYFHNVFDRQLEGIDSNGLQQYFGLSPTVANTLFEGYVNSLAFRGQGAETEIEWQAMKHLFVRGGYTYLNAKVIQSFATDAAAAQNGIPTTNPNLPGIAIGAFSPLVGARPFRRAPHTGYFAVQYSVSKFSVGMTGTLASRSDDSTFLGFSDVNGDNTLLLPNRDLDFAYAKLDAHASVAATRKLTLFTQLDNLLSQQHIGPIGYPSLPFTARGGLTYRFGGE